MLNMMTEKLIGLVLVSIAIAISSGYLIIPVLQKIKLGQFVRDDGPQSHLKKAGTPTMGGIIFLLPLLIIGIIGRSFGALFWATLACGLIGFVDDYIKVVLKRSLGLKVYQKLVAQLLVIAGYIGYQYYSAGINTKIIIPFLPGGLDLGIFWYVFIIFVVLGTINGANLTDGLDGLSASVTSVIILFLAAVAFLTGNLELGLQALILFGGLIGFLWFNVHPAKVFMGDTGSLALGGFVVFASIQMGIPIFILLFGIIYFIESVSVIMQVAYYKKTKKRIFKMTPIHHHFELSGHKETKIVAYFTIITLVCSLIALLAFL